MLISSNVGGAAFRGQVGGVPSCSRKVWRALGGRRVQARYGLRSVIIGEASNPGPPGSAPGTPEASPRSEEFHTPTRFFPGEAAPLPSQAETPPSVLRRIADEGWDSVPSPVRGPRVGDDLTFVGVFGSANAQASVSCPHDLEAGPALREQPVEPDGDGRAACMQSPAEDV